MDEAFLMRRLERLGNVTRQRQRLADRQRPLVDPRRQRDPIDEFQDEGLSADDIRFVEMPPPDMPGALATKAIDAYFVGEPHSARAELDGTGRVLYHAKDIWPRFISCVLVVTDKLVKERPAVV